MHQLSKTKFFTALLSLLFALNSLESYSQMTLKQIVDLPFGENYKLHEKKLKSYFSTTPIFMKGDFNGAFYLKYENQEFDFYGKSTYEFHYIKNILVSAEVELEFFRDRFNQVILLQKLFESDISNTGVFFLDADKLGNIEESEKEIFNCVEKRGDYSQNKTLFVRFWYSEKIRKSNSKSITQSIYLSSDGLVSCRALTNFKFSKLYLERLKWDEGNGIRYVSSKEYPEKQIKLKFENGIYTLPVLLNNKITLDFVLDLGASDVLISADVFQVLLKTGSIQESDIIGEQVYQIADGSTAKSKVFLLKTLKVGDIEIKNVRTSISSSLNSPLLLGQSALKQLGKYQVDNSNSLLIIE